MADLTIDLGVNAGNSSSVISGVTQDLNGLNSSADRASAGLADVGNSANASGDHISGLGVGAIGASAAMADLGGTVQTVTDLWNTGQRRADELSRAQNAVTQASLDMEQATRDAAQAQIDVNQAQRDGVQAGIDLEQALLDQKTAQKAYNETVAEFGKGSLEAQQATIDLKQADEDAKQAKLDSTQATADLKQAQLDGKQATLDGKEAQLDLNEAQRNVVGPSVMASWLGVASSIASVLLGLVGTFTLLQGGMLATAAASVGAALTTVGSWIAMAASATISALAIAAAWLLSILPIAIVIAAVVGLTVLIIKNWDTIERWTIKIFTAIWNWLQGVWTNIVKGVSVAITALKYIFLNFTPLGIIIKNWGAISGWIKSQWDAAVRNVSGAVSRIGGFLSGMWNGITAGLSGALNGAIGMINSAIGGINTLINGANRVPGVSIPNIPYIPFLAEGGITTGPTMAMIGEGREQETVLPLSKLQGLLDMNSGGQNNLTISFQDDTSDDFMTWLKEKIRIDFNGDVTSLNTGR